MKLRPQSQLQMMKSVRALSFLLGKLDIKCLLSDYTPPRSLAFTGIFPRVYYGFSLKEAADFIDRYVRKPGNEL